MSRHDSDHFLTYEEHDRAIAIAEARRTVSYVMLDALRAVIREAEIQAARLAPIDGDGSSLDLDFGLAVDMFEYESAVDEAKERVEHLRWHRDADI